MHEPVSTTSMVVAHVPVRDLRSLYTSYTCSSMVQTQHSLASKTPTIGGRVKVITLFPKGGYHTAIPQFDPTVP